LSPAGVAVKKEYLASLPGCAKEFASRTGGVASLNRRLGTLRVRSEGNRVRGCILEFLLSQATIRAMRTRVKQPMAILLLSHICFCLCCSRPPSHLGGTEYELSKNTLMECETMALDRIRQLGESNTITVEIDKQPAVEVRLLPGKPVFFADSTIGPDYFREYQVPAMVNGAETKQFHIRCWFSQPQGQTILDSVQYILIDKTSAKQPNP
jgi:hypothetical protein